MLKGIQVGTVLQGRVLLQGITFSTTRIGSAMISCTIVDEGGESIQAVSFDADVVKAIKMAESEAVEVEVVGSVDEYNGRKNVKISAVSGLTLDYDATRYLKSLDIAKIVGDVSSLLSRSLSKKALDIIQPFLNSHKGELFYAMASQYGGYHDGYVGGLLNHIRKLLRYTEIVLDEYKDVLSSDEKDLITMGILLHDIGKLDEIVKGCYSPQSIVPHTVLGVMFLEKHLRDGLVSSYGEMFYYELLAIVAEHHGEFGEHPKTIYAYLVHVIDLLDSRVSGLKEKLSGAEDLLSFDGFKLKINRY